MQEEKSVKRNAVHHQSIRWGKHAGAEAGRPPRHLENMAKVPGKVICAGGLLDDEGKMKGSVLIMDFESKELIRQYLDSEPYIKEQVWGNVEVEPMNVVIVSGEKVGS